MANEFDNYLNNEEDELENIWLDLFEALKQQINCQLPCVIETINNNNTVDVRVIQNTQENNQVFPNVPIRHMETSNAYIFLGVSQGDRGVIRFFDNTISNYKLTGNESFDNDVRSHALSDGLFDIGFVPENEHYIYPTDKKLQIGLKNNTFNLSVDDIGETILNSSQNLNFNGGISIGFDTSQLNISGNLSSGTGFSGIIPIGTTLLTFTNGILTNYSS